MIQFLFKNINILNQINYDTSIENLPINTVRCPKCHQKQGYIWFGTYKRHIFQILVLMPICIRRVKCKHCGATHALLPSCIVPYSRISLNDQIEFILSKSINDAQDIFISKNLDESHYHYVRNQYNNHWKQRLLSASIIIGDELIDKCFSFYNRMFMQIKSTSNILLKQNNIRPFDSPS